MRRKLSVVLFAVVLVLSLAASTMAQAEQAKPEQGKIKKLDRWEGNVMMVSSDKTSLVVRKIGTDQKKTIMFDTSTEWVSQEHGSKKTNNITPADVKEGDRVICMGKLDKDGVLHATLISKRLTPLPTR